MPYFTEKLPVLEAHQVPPHSKYYDEDFNAFLEAHLEKVEVTNDNQFIFSGVLAKPGDWVVDHRNGFLSVYSKEKFHEVFDPQEGDT